MRTCGPVYASCGAPDGGVHHGGDGAGDGVGRVEARAVRGTAHTQHRITGVHLGYIVLYIVWEGTSNKPTNKQKCKTRVLPRSSRLDLA